MRNFVIKKIGMLENVKFIFLNENLYKNYKEVNQSIVLHNAADSDLLTINSNKKDRFFLFSSAFSKRIFSRIY